MNRKIMLPLLLAPALLAGTTHAQGSGFKEILTKIGNRLAGPAITIAGNSVAGALTRVAPGAWCPDLDTSLPCFTSNATCVSGPTPAGSASASSTAVSAIWPLCTNAGVCNPIAARTGAGEAYAVCKSGFVTDFAVGSPGMNALVLEMEELSNLGTGPLDYHRRISQLPFDAYSADMPPAIATEVFDPAGQTAMSPTEIYAELNVSLSAGNLTVSGFGFDPMLGVGDFSVDGDGLTYTGHSAPVVQVPSLVEVTDEEYTHVWGSAVEGAELYCFCHSGPCGNNDPGGGCSNSTGQGATLTPFASGEPGIDDLELFAAHLIPNQPALLFVGEAEINGGDGVAFGDGLRGAGVNVVRLGVAVPDANGQALWGPGLGQTGGWSPGDTRYFQVWYRDPIEGPCGYGFNLTNGVEISFQ